MSKMHAIPLALKGTTNTRDLGGYPTLDGKKTICGRFLRSDGLHNLTAADWNFLVSYGVRAVFDLRSDLENRMQSYSPPAEITRFRIPLEDKIQSNLFGKSFPASMGEMYVGMLDSAKERFCKLFRTMLTVDGCALFHCTAGKDRTGLTAMMLLLLANVSESDIVVDYEVTEGYIAANFQKQRKFLTTLGVQVPEYAGWSREADIRMALDHLANSYKNVENYLLSTGLTAQELSVLRARILTE